MKAVKQMTLADIIEFAKSVDKKTWVTVAVSAVGIMLLWFVLIGPAWIERPALRREVQEMTKQIIQVNALNEKRPLLEGDLKAYNELLAKTKDRLFTSDGIGLLLGQVSKLADESRVDVLASRPQNDKLAYAAPYNAKYAANGYEFTVQGGYHELGQLVGRIESYDKLLRIQRLQISGSEKNQERHQAELRVLAFTVAPPLPPAKATKGTKAPNAKKKK